MTTPCQTLIVDNDPATAAELTRILSEVNCSCWRVVDPSNAIALLKTRARKANPFEVVIADMDMEESDLLSLSCAVREHCPDCRLVLTTQQNSGDHVARALTLGCYEYIAKPFTPQEVLRVATAARYGNAARPALHRRAALAITQNSAAQQAALDSVGALVRAVEAKDSFTRRHSDQVAFYSVRLAQAMGLDGQEVESIRRAALLHDIGKIGVPDHILTKPGSLTDEEMLCVRRHPSLGADILSGISVLKEQVVLVRHHHERWDGKGYPDGLVGEEIPLGARIIQVADSMDAMLMERAHRSAYAVERMLGELVRCSGTQFAPAVALAALQWCRMNGDSLILPAGPEPASAVPA